MSDSKYHTLADISTHAMIERVFVLCISKMLAFCRFTIAKVVPGQGRLPQQQLKELNDNSKVKNREISTENSNFFTLLLLN